MRKLIPVLFILTLFAYCNDKPDASGSRDKIEYTPLKDFSFIPSGLQSGTPVKILAYSGGRELRSKDSLFLYEFLCINQQTQDTVKVFASLISVDNPDNPQPTYTTPYLFSGEKHVYDAVFEIVDPEKEKLYLLTSATADPKDLDLTTLSQPMGDVKRFVILNRSISLMIEPRFKSAFGCLHFKQQPW